MNWMNWLLCNQFFIMKTLLTENEFQNHITQNRVTLVYFSTPQCNVCKVLKPKLEQFINQNFEKIKMGYVNIEQIPSISAQNQIFTVPTIVVYFEGKEFIRKSRNLSIDEFNKELTRPYQLFFDQ